MRGVANIAPERMASTLAPEKDTGMEELRESQIGEQ